MHGARLIQLYNIPVRPDCGGRASLLARRRQINIVVVCDGRLIGRPRELAPQRQDGISTVGLQTFWLLEKNVPRWHAGPGTSTTTNECRAITAKYIGTRAYYVKLIGSRWES